ncbi:hypothetical protein KIN20_036714 [Parelaphostrongylus tenuis]|uniref:Uncharacterized protein n=1 Tax=Parelaphostrongylus tenuis TaxID=148309 RepID=A0AAD5RDF2_PARTN|nr:hypothetical protein KIN20_036714 [Parelaphostrongylus tenuis]
MAQWLKVLCDLHHRIMHEVSMLMVPSCTQHSASQPSLRHRYMRRPVLTISPSLSTFLFFSQSATIFFSGWSAPNIVTYASGLKNIRPQARVERTGVLPIPGARVTATPWRPPLCYHSFFDVTYRLCRQPNRRVCFVMPKPQVLWNFFERRGWWNGRRWILLQHFV